jgi:hypothetical protein
MNYESATRSVLVLVWVVLVCLPGKEGSATRSVLVLVWFIPLSSATRSVLVLVWLVLVCLERRRRLTA